ncbi:MAG: NifB/NifX family molybdenum-iron cluster-binding protein [Synechococcales bacterium]|nr:NifB/NifX family molybdenum-iron cluster-binding protein [Synechococcales bacterium]
MKIAIASQPNNQISSHAGHCRTFWIYNTTDDQVLDKTVLNLNADQTFHETFHNQGMQVPHLLDDVDVVIAASMGQGLLNRLEQKQIRAIITSETDPDAAVAAYLDHTLVEVAPDTHHHHEDGHGDGCACATATA